MKYLVSTLAGASAAVFFIWWTAVPTQEVFAMAYDQGRKDALRMNPVSDDLEFTCAGLWFGRDGQQYYQMRKDYEKRTQSK
jgi:hypothetical protein